MPSVEESLCRGLFTVPYTVFTRWQASRIIGIQPYSVIVYENIPEYLSLFLIYYIRFLGVCRLYLYYTIPVGGTLALYRKVYKDCGGKRNKYYLLSHKANYVTNVRIHREYVVLAASGGCIDCCSVHSF